MRSPKALEDPGRLGVFTLLGAAAGSVPLPWVPGSLGRRVRGALVQDVAFRHGLSLSPAARTALAEPSRSEGGSRATRDAMRYLALRMLGRLGPIQFLAPVRSGLATFVLGHLFARYLATRQAEARCIEEPEAAALRRIIDRALLHALMAGAPLESDSSEPPPPEDLRDEITQAVDGVLFATANVPSWLVRRLDAAFDDIRAKG
jgi:hypothetical protein